MIIYQNPKLQFLKDVDDNRVDEILLKSFERNLGHRVGKSEVSAFRNSLDSIGKILRDNVFEDDIGVSIEYVIPQTSKRIDVILTGQTVEGRETAVIVELKQWQQAQRSPKADMVTTFLGGGLRDTPHPSYQAWSYTYLLEQFNEVVYSEDIGIHPCAYLHNCTDGTELRDPAFNEYLLKAPIFLRTEVPELKAFLRERLARGDKRGLMYRIEKGRLRPSKMLADAVVGMVQERPEFALIDEQKDVYETGMLLARRAVSAKDAPKQVLIVRGGPGTGKSVVALNLVTRLLGERISAQYVSRNQAPRDVYGEKLRGTHTRAKVSLLFRGSGSYHAAPPGVMDCLIVDEAHRLTEKSGLYGTDGVNQIMEVIRSARCSVFFIDENQRVTLRDIGAVAEIRKWADSLKAEVTEMELQSQFRCGGSDGYLAWIDHMLQVRETANPTLEDINYDFRVFDCPDEMRRAIEEKNTGNSARLVAGYCWNWVSKNDPLAWDIEIEGTSFRARWNLSEHGMKWIIEPESIRDVGCIHTCQGLELDYVGVIIGPDLTVRDGVVVPNVSARARTDKSVFGWKKRSTTDPIGTRAITDSIIKNTYRTLMSRGMKGCYVYASDPELSAWLKRGQASDLNI
ncbi:MAG: DUF2075 domain-containing protein [Verrucomicrobiota bacterium]